MPKSQKQSTSVKKKTRPGARGRKTNRPLRETPNAVAIDDGVLAAFAALEPPLPTVGKSAPKLKMQQAASNTRKSNIRAENYTDVSEERTSIISIVRGLEEQVDTAFKLKEVLEAELDAIQKKLSEEVTARAQLETQVGSLEAQAALVEQLREDISFAEEERNKFANLHAETQPQLKAVTEERDSLAKQVSSAKTHTKELEDNKMAFEAQVINLKDKLADMDRLSAEFDEVAKARLDLGEQVRDLSSRLQASDTSKYALEKELGSLREQVKNLQERLAGADSRTADLRLQFEEQQAVNKELMEIRTRLESEIKMLSVNHEAATKELEAFKNALLDIRSEAARTSGRVRQRYFKPKDKE
jgi:chromosome segregation ATPase